MGKLSNFEKARLWVEKIKQEHLETEVLTILQESVDPNKLDFEVIYDDGSRSFLLRPQHLNQLGNVVIGVIVNDVVLSVREGLMRADWDHAQKYCQWYKFLDAEMHQLPLNTTLHTLFYRLNLLLENVGGERFSLGWYWTEKEVDKDHAWAINLRTGEMKVFKKSKILRFRPALRLTPSKC